MIDILGTDVRENDDVVYINVASETLEIGKIEEIVLNGNKEVAIIDGKGYYESHEICYITTTNDLDL